MDQPGEASLLTSTASESADMRNVMDSMEALPEVILAAGQMVQGQVLKVTEAEVVVDLGLKTEATAPLAEFLDTEGRVSVAPGDAVDIWIEHYDGTTGQVEISRQEAVRRKAWENIELAFRDQHPVNARVVERIKGGWTVDAGVPAFLPASHADLRMHANLEGLKGQEISCKVIRVNRKRNNVVVSRKLVLEEELEQRRRELEERLVPGTELVGKVKNLTDYGAFVDLGGMDGLLHITDLSWGRVSQPSEVVQVGREIRVKVLKYDAEKGRVSLGLKQLTPDPWEMAPSNYHAGERVTGRVVSLTDYGAFVELEPGIEGLVHASEMSWSKRLRHPAKVVNAGDRVEVVILDVNLARRRISLSLKAALPDPWRTANGKYALGTQVEGRVRNLTEFGAFVELEEGVDGLIHLANLSWNRNIKHPSEVLKKGQKVSAVVLSFDPENRRLALGLKQLEEDPWLRFRAKTHVGDVVEGKVTRQADFGVFVELDEGVEGLCHVSEMEDDPRGDRIKPEVGAVRQFKVIRLASQDKKVSLSMREINAPEPEVPRPEEPVQLSAMAQALSSAGVAPFASGLAVRRKS